MAVSAGALVTALALGGGHRLAAAEGRPIVAAAPVMRLTWFRADGAAFDERVRAEVVPGFRRSRGLCRLYLGRQGPEEDGRRVLVTLWASMRALMAARGSSGHGRQALPELVQARRETIPLSLLVFGVPDQSSGGILRIARGQLREGQRDSYLAQVRDGLREDRARGHGPGWLALGFLGADRFLTLSGWRDWASIEGATGATIEAPIRTKRSDALRSFEAEHLELVSI